MEGGVLAVLATTGCEPDIETNVLYLELCMNR